MDAAPAHAVDIASLAQQLREELATAEAPAARSASGCPVVIAEVGRLTREVSPEAYDPYHVSMGPYHHIRNPDLARRDDKLRCLATVLSAAASDGAGGVTLEDYLRLVARIEARARSCYANTFDTFIDSNDFVRMLLLDACYVLVRFGGVGGSGSGVGGGGDMMEAVGVVRDVIYLAENQIPFFVVDEIHKLTFPDGGGVSAAEAIAGYIRELLRGQQYSVATPAVAAPPGPGNLLHLLHMHLKPTTLSRTTSTGAKVTGGKERRRFGRWRSATEYYCAGVGFRSRALTGGKGEARSILDVRLDGRGGGARLEMPRLRIDAETARLLRNLMALEQSNPAAAGSHVTAYCVFLSQLAGTAADVGLLSRRGVLAHGLGCHDEVAACLADLCKGVAFGGDDPEGNYLRATWQGLEESFRSRPRRWAAWLLLRYFRNPWLAVGLAAAAVGMVCTVVQAVYAVLAYSPSP